MAENTPTPPADFDYDAVVEGANEKQSEYPLGQWLNGKPSFKVLGSDKVAYSGGLIFEEDHVRGIAVGPELQKQTVILSDKEKEAFVSGRPQLAVLRTRFIWETGQGNFRRDEYDAIKHLGPKGRLHALCWVKGLGFAIISFGGKSSTAGFEAALKALADGPLALANKTAPKGKELPQFALFLTLQPGKHEALVGKDGSKSTVTTPQIALPEEVNREWCLTQYVGRNLYLQLQDKFLATDTWAKDWIDAKTKAKAVTSAAE